MGSSYTPPVNLASPGPIGDTTPNTGTFTGLTTTSSQSNFVGGIELRANGVISGALNSGNQANVDTGGISLGSGGTLRWGDATYTHVSTFDLFLLRETANTLALVNGVNAQGFNCYVTKTNGSNFKLANVGSIAGVPAFYGYGLGTGISPGTILGYGGATQIWSNDALRWTINSSGHFLAAGAYNIGDGAGNSPVNIYAESYIVAGSFTVGTLPSAATAGAGAMAYVTDAAVADVMAISDGTNWKRADAAATTVV